MRRFEAAAENSLLATADSRFCEPPKQFSYAGGQAEGAEKQEEKRRGVKAHVQPVTDRPSGNDRSDEDKGQLNREGKNARQ